MYSNVFDFEITYDEKAIDKILDEEMIISRN